MKINRLIDSYTPTELRSARAITSDKFVYLFDDSNENDSINNHK